MTSNVEKELVSAFMLAKHNADLAKQAYDAHKTALDIAQAKLVEYMEDQDQTSTGKYEGIGHVTLAKPRLFASYSKENIGSVFEFLKAHGFGDLIQPTVNASSLSSVVGNLLESGVEIPETINVFMKSQVRAYKAK